MRPTLAAALALTGPLFALACSPSSPGPGDARTTDAPDAAGSDASSDTGSMGACLPGTRRCDPESPSVPQVCRADGSGYDPSGAACDPAAGRACSLGRCTDPCAESASQRSNLGCDYYAVTSANAVDATFTFALAVANGNPFPVRLTVEGGALAAPATRDVPAGETAVVSLPWVPALALNGIASTTVSSARVDGGAYHLRSTAPVSAYQFSPLEYRIGTRLSQSNDASLLLAAPSLGGRYLALTYGDGERPLAPSLVTIVGTSETPTEVTVTPTADTLAGDGIAAGSAGVAQRFTLRRGDVVQLLSMTGTADLTGTVVDASGPVAVFAGNRCAYVPRRMSFCDHLEEQLVPREAWGTRVPVTAFRHWDDVESIVRVLADRANTRVTFDPADVHAPVTLGAGEVLELTTRADFVLDASSPVLVGQLMRGELNVPGGELMSPALVYEIPSAQFRDDSRFLTPDTFTRSLVNVVGTSPSPPMIDGAPIAAAPRALGASGLSVWTTDLAPGPHRVTGPAGARFGVKVYGVAPNTSYAYPAAMDLAVINPPG